MANKMVCVAEASVRACKILTLFLCLNVCHVAFASAQVEIGPDVVVSEGIYESCLGGRTGQDLINCLSQAGASDASLAYIEVSSASEEPLEIAVAFREYGEVDVLEVFFPEFTNSNGRYRLVNGSPQIIDAGAMFPKQIPDDAVSRSILARYPQASSDWYMTIGEEHRILPDGKQRFVFSRFVIDGCRACDVVGLEVIYIDFENGKEVGFSNLGWLPAIGDGTPRSMTGALSRGDVRALQASLNLRGYFAGPVDGASGQMTNMALAVFQQDHCLPVSESLSEAAVNALTSSEPAECVDRDGVRFPFADGVYSPDSNMCDAVLTDPESYGDAEGVFMHIVGAQISFYESSCSIGSVSDHGTTIELEATCSGEGMDWVEEMSLIKVSVSSFRYRNEVYELCGGPTGMPEGAASTPVGGTVEQLRANLTTSFGAYGPGTGQAAYFENQLHPAIDVGATAGDPVSAPVTGLIVYYHRLNGSGQALWLQSFVVLRDDFGRDWVLGHFNCVICGQTGVGDRTAWRRINAGADDQSETPLRVEQGQFLGVVADLRRESVDQGYSERVGNHLHIGLSTKALVDENGLLLDAFQGGSWGRLRFGGSTGLDLNGARRAAAELGWIDPLQVIGD